MRRNLLISILTWVFFLIGIDISYAISFDNTQSYGGSTVITIDQDRSGYSDVLSQTVTFSPLLANLNSASLDVDYSGIHTNETSELWFVLGSDINDTPSTFTQLGQLNAHLTPNARAMQTFDLSAFVPTVPTGGLSSWTWYFVLWENSTGNGDKLDLYSTRIYGDYDAYQAPQNNIPTPEPATILLFSSGLICLVGFRRKLKKS